MWYLGRGPTEASGGSLSIPKTEVLEGDLRRVLLDSWDPVSTPQTFCICVCVSPS